MAVITLDIVNDAIRSLHEYADIIANVCVGGGQRWACQECAGKVCKSHQDYTAVMRTIRALRTCVGHNPSPPAGHVERLNSGGSPNTGKAE